MKSIEDSITNGFNNLTRSLQYVLFIYHHKHSTFQCRPIVSALQQNQNRGENQEGENQEESRTIIYRGPTNSEFQRAMKSLEEAITNGFKNITLSLQYVLYTFTQAHAFNK